MEPKSVCLKCWLIRPSRLRAAEWGSRGRSTADPAVGRRRKHALEWIRPVAQNHSLEWIRPTVVAFDNNSKKQSDLVASAAQIVNLVVFLLRGFGCTWVVLNLLETRKISEVDRVRILGPIFAKATSLARTHVFFNVFLLSRLLNNPRCAMSRLAVKRFSRPCRFIVYKG